MISTFEQKYYLATAATMQKTFNCDKTLKKPELIDTSEQIIGLMSVTEEGRLGGGGEREGEGKRGRGEERERLE